MLRVKLLICVGFVSSLALVGALAGPRAVAHRASRTKPPRSESAVSGPAAQTASSSESANAKAAKAILQNSCSSCHGASRMSGLDLRERETMLRGGARGAAVVPGKAEESLLYRVVAGLSEPKMPPGKQTLSPEEVKTLRDWINEGASWEEKEAPKETTSSAATLEHAAITVLSNNCANDFGRQGDAPTHPELLDWLASEFIARGWSVKQMHRLMMLSNAYQMSNRYDERNAQIDADNHYLWRMNRRRLEAEAVRDTILATAGTLNLKMGGPPVIPLLNKEELAGLSGGGEWPATKDPDAQVRRGAYLYVKRTFRIPMLEIFDSPDSSFSCARREATNVAPQALALLNNDFVFKQAEEFAARLVRENKDGGPAAWVESGWRLALGRAPSAQEKQKALEIFFHGTEAAPANGVAASGGEKSFGEGRAAGLTKFCLMLFNLNEFIYID